MNENAIVKEQKDQIIALIQANLKLIKSSLLLTEENKRLQKKILDVNALYLKAVEDKKKVLSKMSPSMN
jgi:hypothetical protein